MNRDGAIQDAITFTVFLDSARRRAVGDLTAYWAIHTSNDAARRKAYILALNNAALAALLGQRYVQLSFDRSHAMIAIRGCRSSAPGALRVTAVGAISCTNFARSLVDQGIEIVGKGEVYPLTVAGDVFLLNLNDRLPNRFAKRPAPAAVG